jgi:hemolysin III
MNNEVVQSPKEEILNSITHGFGFIGASFASVMLMYQGLTEGIHIRFISYMIYSFGLLTLYLASTLYHSAKDPRMKKRLNVFDHSAIYLLIAGTYTPISLLSIGGTWGIVLLCVVWIIAISGIVMKFLFTRRNSWISTSTYLLMGWVVIFAIKPLINSMALPGLLLLLAGGIFYSSGALLYQKRSMKYNHVIFHVLVLFGSICHYIAILNYT